MTTKCPGPVAVKQAQMQLWKAKLYHHILFRKNKLSLRSSPWIFFCSFSEHYTLSTWCEFARMSIHGKVGRNFVNNLSHCVMMDLQSYNPSQIDSWFFEIVADFFLPWHCVYTHLNASEQQTVKPSTFIKMLTPTDDHLIRYIWLPAPGYYLPLYFQWMQ